MQISSHFDTFIPIFRHLKINNEVMKWLLNKLFKKKDLIKDNDLIVQKILLKKYLLR